MSDERTLAEAMRDGAQALREMTEALRKAVARVAPPEKDPDAELVRQAAAQDAVIKDYMRQFDHLRARNERVMRFLAVWEEEFGPAVSGVRARFKRGLIDLMQDLEKMDEEFALDG